VNGVTRMTPEQRVGVGRPGVRYITTGWSGRDDAHVGEEERRGDGKNKT